MEAGAAMPDDSLVTRPSSRNATNATNATSATATVASAVTIAVRP
jgi:hypothetical protein